MATKKSIKNISYTESIKEVEQIITSLSSGEVDLDSLPDKIKRGAELIVLCKSKLQATEDSVNKIFEEK